MKLYVESFIKDEVTGICNAVLDFPTDTSFIKYFKKKGVTVKVEDQSMIELKNFTTKRRWREGYNHEIDLDSITLTPVTDSYCIGYEADLGGALI